MCLPKCWHDNSSSQVWWNMLLFRCVAMVNDMRPSVVIACDKYTSNIDTWIQNNQVTICSVITAHNILSDIPYTLLIWTGYYCQPSELILAKINNGNTLGKTWDWLFYTLCIWCPMYLIVLTLTFMSSDCCVDCINTLRQRQNGRHFLDDIFKSIFWMKMYRFWSRIH